MNGTAFSPLTILCTMNFGRRKFVQLGMGRALFHWNRLLTQGVSNHTAKPCRGPKLPASFNAHFVDIAAAAGCARR